MVQIKHEYEKLAKRTLYEHIQVRMKIGFDRYEQHIDIVF